MARDASLSPEDADPRLDRLQIRSHGGLLYALFFVLLGSARAQPPAPEAQGQTLEGRSLVDHDAGFTLTIPSTDWRLASEPDARALVADAVAGAMGKNGHFGMVVVEDMAADLDAMNDLALDSLDSVVTDGISQEKITFQGQPAIRSVLELNINDIRLRQQRVVFEWDRHFFQLVCNGPLTPADNRCSERFTGGGRDPPAELWTARRHGRGRHLLEGQAGGDVPRRRDVRGRASAVEVRGVPAGLGGGVRAGTALDQRTFFQ